MAFASILIDLRASPWIGGYLTQNRSRRGHAYHKKGGPRASTQFSLLYFVHECRVSSFPDPLTELLDGVKVENDTDMQVPQSLMRIWFVSHHPCLLRW